MGYARTAFEKNSSKEAVYNSKDFLTNYLIENEIQSFLIKNNQKKEERREQQLHNFFQKWFIAEKLKLACMNLILERQQRSPINHMELGQELNLLSTKSFLERKSNSGLMALHLFVIKISNK